MRLVRAIALVAVGSGGCAGADVAGVERDREADLARLERAVGARVLEPRFAPDGTRVAFVELPPGVKDYQPGTPTRLVVMDLARGTRRVVSEHPLDSSPWPVPGSDDVMFVSGRTGVASIWRSSPGRPPRQVTNVGLTRVGPEFVPVEVDLP